MRMNLNLDSFAEKRCADTMALEDRYRASIPAPILRSAIQQRLEKYLYKSERSDGRYFFFFYDQLF